MNRIGWRIIPILFFLLLSVLLWRGLSLDPHTLPSVQVGKILPAFALPELIHPEKIFKSNQIPQQVVLLNVWASWCAACVDEQVFMMELSRKGVPVYGLNYKDNADDAIKWLEQWGNPYKVIVQDSQGKTAIDLGVYGAPETFIIDKKGLIRYRHAGIMSQKVWADEMAPLMKQLDNNG